jgi:hypothetical protein
MLLNIVDAAQQQAYSSVVQITAYSALLRLPLARRPGLSLITVLSVYKVQLDLSNSSCYAASY